jgi:hydrogenase-4 component F
LLLGVVFVGMGVTVLAVVQGKPLDTTPQTGIHDNVSTGAPIVLFLAVVLLLGLYIPPPLESLLRDAAVLLGAKPT